MGVWAKNRRRDARDMNHFVQAMPLAPTAPMYAPGYFPITPGDYIPPPPQGRWVWIPDYVPTPPPTPYWLPNTPIWCGELDVVTVSYTDGAEITLQ